MTLQERLAELPQDKHITYTCYGCEPHRYYQASWRVNGKQYYRYLGRDRDETIAARIVASGQRRNAPRSTLLSCGHITPKLNCELCIWAATWQMREKSNVVYVK